MAIDFQVIRAASQFPGFRNYTIKSGSGSIAAQSLGVGGVASSSTSIALDNTDSVSQVQVQYSGVNTNYFMMPGIIIYNPSANYQIQTIGYYTGGNLVVATYVSNQTAGSVSIPAITINIRAFLFLTPEAN